jgi:aryl-alcohol dehydrogenase-like predicted oxidoreductase
MRMRRLGADGPEITVVGYGAWQAGGRSWGERRPDAEVIDAMRTALDSGQNWIDTAEVYGDGVSEQLVGRAIEGRRDQMLVFTKVAPDDEGSGIRPDQIRSAVEGSLRRLGIDHIDLYQVHWSDDAVPVEETWGAMADLVREGLVRHIGVSNFDRSLIERCLAIHPVASVQNEFSLIEQTDREALLPWLAELGIGYLCYSPLGSGLLSGTLSADTTFGDGDWRCGELAATRVADAAARVGHLRTVASRLDAPVASVVLAWAIQQRGVTAAIAGSLKADHVRANSGAGDLELDPTTLAEIDRIFTPTAA